MGRVGRELLAWHSSSSSSERGDHHFLTQFINKLGDKRFEGIIFFAGRGGRREGEGTSSAEWKDRRELLKALFTTCKILGQRQVSPLPRLHLVTTGAWVSGHEDDLSVSDPSSSALWGFARSWKAEISELNSKCIDLDPSSGASSTDSMERLLMELWLDDKEPDVLHRQGIRHVRRLRAEKQRQQQTSTSNLEFPLSPRFEIALPTTRAISDLRFVPKEQLSVGGAELQGQEIEVELRSASLNFRDVLVVMRPTGSVFETMSGIGIDYAGVVSRVGPRVTRLQVGQRVYGISSTGESTISSHIVTEESHGARIPPGLTFAQAATLPAVFLTVWYCMVRVARVKRGQRVLVHAVSGGVGLVAIQLGRILGVEVIGTAGSPRKRNYARSLGLKHVFNSRDLTFAEGVEQATGGAGVDMVLNCLTGPGFKEASLELVKDGGHFVEISKLDVWSVEEVRRRRPAVHYQIVSLPEVRPEIISEMMSEMNELVESGDLLPLPMTRFQASQLPSALTALQRAKLIGKVILELPLFHLEGNRFVEQLFGDDDATYLVTGGLGAIGLAIAKWMAAQGARYLVLVGRSPPNQVALEAISQLTDQFKGTTVVCRQADISSYEQCQALFESLFSDGEHPSLPPLGGIHHCAGILSDKLLVNQDWAEFVSVLKPKVDGLYNLHRLTAHHHLPLQFFVAHSSMSSTIGNVGQTNYTAGNAYMDSLMEARVQAGLPGLLVNWGQWKAGLAEHVEMRIATPFSVPEGIAALERFFLENKTGVVAGHMNFPQIIKMIPAYSHTFLKYVVELGENKGKDGGDGAGAGNKVEAADPFLLQYNKRKEEGGMTEEERGALIARFVKDTVGSILGLRNEEIEDSTDFSAMGMDSLMSIDFTNKLQAELPGLPVGYIDMAEFGTVTKMSGFVDSFIN